MAPFAFAAAVRLSRFADHHFSLIGANQTLRPERIYRVHESGNVGAMIPPGAAGSWTGTGHQLFDAASLCAHYGAWRSIRAEIHRIGDSIEVLIRRANLDILEHGYAGIGWDGWGIDYLQITTKRAVVDNALFEIGELLGRALHTIGRINDGALAVAIQKIGYSQRDGIP